MNRLRYVLQTIEERNPVHAKKLAGDLAALDSPYESEANAFLDRYSHVLMSDGHDLDFAIDCYLKLLDDVLVERVEFLRTGKYSSSSFQEVNERVYNNPRIMTYYMHGLLLSQFLWHQHYKIYRFFANLIQTFVPKTRRYLEVGGGHGLYLHSFCSASQADTEIEVVDISPTSLRMCEEIANAPNAKFILSDIHDFSRSSYDFITMGEVLEHVEDPVKLLRKLRSLCKNSGAIFITTPTNAPAIDHLYLFEDVQDIRDVIKEAGLDVIEEVQVETERIKTGKAADVKIATLYGALLAPSQS